MKYVVMQSTSGNIIIKSEWTDKNNAKQAYHDRPVCHTQMWLI